MRKYFTPYVNVCSLILLHSFAKIYEIGNCTILFLCLKTELSHGLLPDIELLKKPKRFWNYPNFFAVRLIDQASVLQFTAINSFRKIKVPQ